MISHIQKDSKDNVVGMCGDGANDCGALKSANVGLSLSEAEASIAAPFTSKVQDISCVPTLLKEGRSALATSYQCFKYMALYSVIQFTSVTILYFQLIDLTNWHYYHQDIMAVLPFSTTMAMSGTSAFLTKYRPAARLISVNILTSVIGQAFIQIGFQMGIYLMLLQQDWFIPCGQDWNSRDACYNNTSLYLLAVYQYAFVALAFLVGRPFRKSFYTNLYFTIYFVLFFFFNIQMTFNVLHWRFIYDQMWWAAEVPLPYEWRTFIFCWAMINSVVTLVWERVVVKYIAIRTRENEEKNSRRKSIANQRRKSSLKKKPQNISLIGMAPKS